MTDEARRQYFRDKTAEWRAKNPDRQKAIEERRKAKYAQDGSARRAANTYWAKLWDALLEGYGKKCACCGEEEVSFLELHHLNEGGKAHFESLGLAVNKTNRMALYRDLRDRNFPPIVVLLCGSCHNAVSRMGFCPHDPERTW